MKLDQARTLAAVLDKAVKDAEAAGADEVNLTDVLRAADDQARSELQAAIAKAEAAGKGPAS